MKRKSPGPPKSVRDLDSVCAGLTCYGVKTGSGVKSLMSMDGVLLKAMKAIMVQVSAERSGPLLMEHDCR